MKQYIVWNSFYLAINNRGSVNKTTYVTNAESAVRAIQNAMSIGNQHIPSDQWNVATLDSYSIKAQTKILNNAVAI
jgi:hypothetical protein